MTSPVIKESLKKYHKYINSAEQSQAKGLILNIFIPVLPILTIFHVSYGFDNQIISENVRNFTISLDGWLKK